MSENGRNEQKKVFKIEKFELKLKLMNSETCTPLFCSNRLFLPPISAEYSALHQECVPTTEVFFMKIFFSVMLIIFSPRRSVTLCLGSTVRRWPGSIIISLFNCFYLIIIIRCPGRWHASSAIPSPRQGHYSWINDFMDRQKDVYSRNYGG